MAHAGGRSLLCEVKREIAAQSVAYGLFVAAIVLLCVGAINFGAMLQRPSSLDVVTALTSSAGFTIMLALLIFGGAHWLSRWAQDRMGDAFSRFWRRHLPALREAVALKDSDEPAVTRL
jgi:hypothetical protein